MRIRRLSVSATLLAAAVLTWPAISTAADAPRITAADLKPMLERGEAVLVDVRGKEGWDRRRAKGARHIPLTELPSRLGELPKNKLIAAYCT